MSPTEIKILMQKYGIAPRKFFGQNFLISDGILNKIVASAGLSKDDIVLEVGPGLGVLTFKMAPHVKKIIAIEKDRVLINILKEQITERSIDNIQIIEGDVMKFEPRTQNLESRTYSLVANIPYYLTSALIRKFLESENKPQKLILMIQKEVAQRICATPPVGGQAKYDQKMSILAISVQFYADAKILFYVSKENFWPAPKVDSAIIEITPKKDLPNINEDLFFKIVKAGFANKRKQLAGNLSQLVIASDSKERNNLKSQKEKIEELLKSIGLNPKTRAEELSLEDWVRLTKLL